jgi:DNA-binding transcriptional MerR regulator
VPELRISELAERSRVPIPTIKYYLREGLLQRGESSSATQAKYGPEHISRLGLIKTLTGLAGLSLAQVRSVCQAIDGGDGRHAIRAVGAPGDEISTGVMTEVDSFVDEELGWRVDPEAPARRALARAVVALRSIGRAADLAELKPHARAADWLVSEEIEDRPHDVADAVIAAIAFDAAETALRHLAWEHRISPARVGSPP